jgi:hypothetical protein
MIRNNHLSLPYCIALSILLFALLIGPRLASSAAKPDSPAPEQAQDVVMTNPRWLIHRVASHLVDGTADAPTHQARTFRKDVNGHFHVVYGSDRLYYAYDDGTGWKTETIDDNYGGVYSASLVLDASGIPHVSYCRRVNPSNQVVYAWRGGGGWQTTVVAPSNCSTTSIALISASAIAEILYFDLGNPQGNSSLKLASRDAYSGAWIIETVASSLSFTSHRNPVNLVIGNGNIRHVSYYDENGKKLVYIRHPPAGWETPITVAPNIGDTYHSLALDPSGNPCLSYISAGGGLTLACMSAGVFNYTVVRNPVAPGYFDVNSLDYESGQPAIAYRYDQSDGLIKFWVSRFDGSIWRHDISFQVYSNSSYVNLVFPSFQDFRLVYDDSPYLYDGYFSFPSFLKREIDHTRVYINGTSLALDSTGRPHISFNQSTEGYLLRAFQNPLGQWDVINLDVSNGVGMHSSIAIGPGDLEQVAYFDATNGKLLLIEDSGGSYMPPVTIDGGGSTVVGQYPSLKLDSSGRASISYYDVTNKDLKYAWYDTAWHTTTVDSAGDVGQRSTLVLDGSHYAHIAYYDATNQALKYAYQNASGWHIGAIADPPGGDAGGLSSLAAIPGGYAIAYLNNDGAAWTVKYTGCHNVMGNCVWGLTPTETVSTDTYPYFDSGDVSGISLAVRSSGVPLVAYNSYNGDLMVAEKAGSAWRADRVDNTILYTGRNNNLAVDNKGRVHVIYQDPFYGLRYAVSLPNIFLPLVRK